MKVLVFGQRALLKKKRRNWIALWTAITAMVAWVLASGLDVFSVFLVVQVGNRPLVWAHRAAEYLIVYAVMRLLGALALALLVIWLSKHRSSWSRAIWGGLTACSLATALLAWLRLYR